MIMQNAGQRERERETLIIIIRINCKILPTDLFLDQTGYWNLCKEERCLKIYISRKMRIFLLEG
jgi:hypothetical protein